MFLPTRVATTTRSSKATKQSATLWRVPRILFAFARTCGCRRGVADSTRSIDDGLRVCKNPLLSYWGARYGTRNTVAHAPQDTIRAGAVVWWCMHGREQPSIVKLCELSKIGHAPRTTASQDGHRTSTSRASDPRVCWEPCASVRGRGRGAWFPVDRTLAVHAHNMSACTRVPRAYHTPGTGARMCCPQGHLNTSHAGGGVRRSKHAGHATTSLACWPGCAAPLALAVPVLHARVCEPYFSSPQDKSDARRTVKYQHAGSHPDSQKRQAGAALKMLALRVCRLQQRHQIQKLVRE